MASRYFSVGMGETLKDFEPAFQAAILALSQDDYLRTALQYATARGKRIRPFLMLELAQLLQLDRSQVRVAAIAVEMMHAYSLVHDDLPAMDDDDLRRGQPTVHIQFDEATAILVGDALQAGAFGMIADADNVPVAVRLRWVSRLAESAGAEGMVLGQYYDIAAESQQDLPLEKLQNIQRLKTGAVFGFCCLALADMHAEKDLLQPVLQAFADDLGELFQLSDDIIGATISSEISGKTTGSDMRHKKCTMVQALGLEGARARVENLAISAQQNLERITHYSTAATLDSAAIASKNLLTDLLRWLPRRQY